MKMERVFDGQIHEFLRNKCSHIIIRKVKTKANTIYKKVKRNLFPNINLHLADEPRTLFVLSLYTF